MSRKPHDSSSFQHAMTCAEQTRNVPCHKERLLFAGRPSPESSKGGRIAMCVWHGGQSGHGHAHVDGNLLLEKAAAATKVATRAA